jgi:hypothetical protein
VSPKRGNRVAPPPVKGEWEVKFGTSEAAKGWEDLCIQAKAKTREAYELMGSNPRPPQDESHYQLRGGAIAARSFGGRDKGQRKRADLVPARRRKAHRMGGVRVPRTSQGDRAVTRGRPHRTRYSRCTDSAATSGVGPSRNRSHGANERGGRNACTARLRVRCAQRVAPAAAARGWADSVRKSWATSAWVRREQGSERVQQRPVTAACQHDRQDTKLAGNHGSWAS